MLIPRHWRPQRFPEALRAIDAEAENERVALDFRKPAIVLITMACCLLLIHYLKYSSVFQQMLLQYSQFVGGDNGIFHIIRQGSWYQLYTQVWWVGWHIVGYVLIPLVIIRYVLKERLTDYGIGLGDTKRYLPYYIALASPIIFFAFLVSFRDDFVNHYPFYRLASRSIVDLLLWELLYIIQFIALEFFFRGFVLHACKPTFGAVAVFVMSVPYLMIHFPKPWLEAIGAIPFGILLGVLALRSRSIWGGAGVHVTIALSMDLLALLQANKLPTRWLP